MNRIVFAALLVACGTPPAAEEPRTLASELREGAWLYDRYCALCHGNEGEGYAADNATRLNSQSLLRTASDEFFFTAIAVGRADTAMAAYGEDYGGPLTREQIEALVAWIRSWQREPSLDLSDVTVSGDAKRGAELWSAHCASCHGASGEGASAQSLTKPSFLSTVSDGFLRYAIVHGRDGTPMPAFEETLSAQEIDDLVVYLRSFEERPSSTATELSPPSAERMPLMRYPDGPRPNFSLREGRFVAASQVREALEQRSRMILLDARPTSDWLRRRLPGALPVPYYDPTPILDRLPRDGTWIIAYCGCPHAASGAVVDALREAGFENTAVLDEGVFHWIEQGYPTESGPAE